MGIKIICWLFAAYVNVLVCAENDARREGFRISIEDFGPEISDAESDELYGRVIKVERGDEESREEKNLLKLTESMDKSHRKILEFGKRVFESVKAHEILKNEANLVELGEYRIDWWKNNRRLAKIRKRLYKELARMPDLNDHLHRLGWRNTSKDFIPGKKNQPPVIEVKQSMEETRNTLVKKIMKLSFMEFVDIDQPEFDPETIDNVPIMFVYVKLMLSRPKKINRLDPNADVPKSPMKFSLDVTEPQDFDTSDANVLDIGTHSLPISNPIDALNSGGVSIDTDRVLQLIPLVVDELRNDRFSEEERFSLSWIFGKRLWQLLARDAGKNEDDMMDKDLASFLVKGELPERESERPKRRSRNSGQWQRKNLRNERINELATKSDEGRLERSTDYVSRSSSKNHDNQRSINTPFFYYNRKNDFVNSENSLNLEFTNLARFFMPKKFLHENHQEEGAKLEPKESSIEPADEYEGYFFQYFYK